MNKRVMRFLTVTGFGLFIVGMVMVLSSTSSSYPQSTGTVTGGAATLALGSIGGGALLITIAWLGLMAKLAKKEAWGCFFSSLLFGGVALLYYLFAGED